MKEAPSITYRPQIDGLRMCAVLPVLFFHYDLFPLISGGGFCWGRCFLVNSIILSEIQKNKFNFKTFYERRVRRLFPAIISLLFFLLVTGYYLYTEKNKFKELLKQLVFSLLSSVNFYFYSKSSENVALNYNGQQSKQWPLLHFWSLAVEEQFYLIMPLILAGISKIFKKYHLTIVALVFFFITATFSFILTTYYVKTDSMFAFYLLPCRAWELALGGILAVLLSPQFKQYLEKMVPKLSQNTFFKNEAFITLILQILGWSGLLMILLSYIYLDEKSAQFPGYRAFLPCLGTVLFISANFTRYSKKIKLPSQQLTETNQAVNINGPIKIENQEEQRICLTSARILSLQVFVWIGKISYAIYLWHWPILVLTKYTLPLDESQLSLRERIYSIIHTIVIAELSRRFIEDPFRSKTIVSSKTLWRFFVGATCCILAVGILGIYLDIGRVQQNRKPIEQKNTLKPQTLTHLFDSEVNKVSNFTPEIYDDDGYLILNPYASLPQQLINQKILALKEPTLPGYDAWSINPGRLDFKRPTPQWAPYFVKKNQQNERLCVLILGNSHTRQHQVVLHDLAWQANLSMAFLVQGSSMIEWGTENPKAFDDWRLGQIKKLKPKVIFTQIYWPYCSSLHGLSAQKRIARYLDPLLKLQQPPELIVLFGDNPAITKNNKIWNLAEYLIEKYYKEQNKSWNFLAQFHEPAIQTQSQVQQRIKSFIEKNYDSKIVKFYTTKHLLIDPKTGNLQVAASQAGGELLFLDKSHLSFYGSRRYQNYLRQKVFRKAQQIC